MKRLDYFIFMAMMTIVVPLAFTSCGGDDGDDNGGGSTPGGSGSQQTTIVGEWWRMIDRNTEKSTTTVNDDTEIIVEKVKANGQITETTYWYSPYSTDRVTKGWNYEVEELTYTLNGKQITITDSKGKQISGTYYIASNNNTTIFVVSAAGESMTWGIVTNEVRNIISSLNAVAYKNGGGGNTSYNPCPDNNHPHMIDLGLPSGTKWACCNVGANAPDLYGNKYPWASTAPLSDGVVEDMNYPYYYYADSGDGLTISPHITMTNYDVAHVTWGGEWYMPTKYQCQELCEHTTTSWTTLNGLDVLKVTGSNGNSIYLPAAGGFWNGVAMSEGTGGSFWSSDYASAGYSNGFCFKQGEQMKTSIDYVQRAHSVRPVIYGSGSSSFSINSIRGTYTVTEYQYYHDEKAWYEMEPQYEMTITEVSTSDPTSVEIYNLWEGGKYIKGQLDTETGEITIPSGQIIYEDPTYGNIWVNPYENEITFTYDADKRTYSSNIMSPVCSEGHFRYFMIKMVFSRF